MHTLPQYVKTVLQTLEANAHKAYLVGGCVRDLFMGKVPHDFDIATSARPEEVAALFPKVVPTGLKHGTVTVLIDDVPIEITTFRKDGVYRDHRRPDEVIYVDDLTEDLFRRDFTMNAMALTIDGKLEDPTGGQADIQNKTIRAVGDPAVRFEEDALRMFRTLRFSAQLGFTIEEKTRTAIREKSSLAQSLSAERVRDEMEKILCSDRPETVADVLGFGLLHVYIKDVPLDRNVLRCLRFFRGTPMRWCGLAAILLRANAISHPETFLQALRLPRTIVELMADAATLAQTPLPDDRIALKRLMAANGSVTVLHAAEVQACLGAPSKIKDIEDILYSGECYSFETLALGGTDLLAYGIPQGVQIGETLQKLLDYVIQHPEANKREILLETLDSL